MTLKDVVPSATPGCGNPVTNDSGRRTGRSMMVTSSNPAIVSPQVSVLTMKFIHNDGGLDPGGIAFSLSCWFTVLVIVL